MLQVYVGLNEVLTFVSSSSSAATSTVAALCFNVRRQILPVGDMQDVLARKNLMFNEMQSLLEYSHGSSVSLYLLLCIFRSHTSGQRHSSPLPQAKGYAATSVASAALRDS